MNEGYIDVDVNFYPDNAELGVFWRYYEIEKRFHASESNWRQAMWGKSKTNERVCRFCKKDASSTSFRKLAHLIPALMGNKVLFSGYECDNCNMLFSKYENDLANFSGIWHTLSQVSGRGGVSKFKDKKNKFHIISKDNQLHLYIKDLKKGGVNVNNEMLSINTFKPAFIPRNVFKCFVKIALGFLDKKNLGGYEKTRRWLIGEIPEKAIAMHPYFYVPRARGTKKLNEPLIMLMKRKQFDAPFAIPEHCLLIFYGIFIYQIFIPFHQSEVTQFSKGKLYIPIAEYLCQEISSDNPNGAAQVNIMNMGATIKVKGLDEIIRLPFRKV
ncbi:hypothetical protein C900_02311 [Fulvivirga imtechensis AK7]|uniref:HNH endonuclease 5 domain-containing protein n=1 Tax=Fulvivirga imtechensis AK7 TaxID=1237149 RepID=L8JRZ2_9BACT|nr:HNH endonuclease [Fulvivirga imtechensis]ELR71726.1 hypothetical protein C900_02311 [Fulvivirga imtechensis AK7]